MLGAIITILAGIIGTKLFSSRALRETVQHTIPHSLLYSQIGPTGSSWPRSTNVMQTHECSESTREFTG
jgi:hypothetical protein